MGLAAWVTKTSNNICQDSWSHAEIRTDCLSNASSTYDCCVNQLNISTSGITICLRLTRTVNLETLLYFLNF
jgi:hypothetical protein